MRGRPEPRGVDTRILASRIHGRLWPGPAVSPSPSTRFTKPFAFDRPSSAQNEFPPRIARTMAPASRMSSASINVLACKLEDVHVSGHGNGPVEDRDPRVRVRGADGSDLPLRGELVEFHEVLSGMLRESHECQIRIHGV